MKSTALRLVDTKWPSTPAICKCMCGDRANKPSTPPLKLTRIATNPTALIIRVGKQPGRYSVAHIAMIRPGTHPPFHTCRKTSSKRDTEVICRQATQQSWLLRLPYRHQEGQPHPSRKQSEKAVRSTVVFRRLINWVGKEIGVNGGYLCVL